MSWKEHSTAPFGLPFFTCDEILIMFTFFTPSISLCLGFVLPTRWKGIYMIKLRLINFEREWKRTLCSCPFMRPKIKVWKWGMTWKQSLYVYFVPLNLRKRKARSRFRIGMLYTYSTAFSVQQKKIWFVLSRLAFRSLLSYLCWSKGGEGEKRDEKKSWWFVLPLKMPLMGWECVRCL